MLNWDSAVLLARRRIYGRCENWARRVKVSRRERGKSWWGNAAWRPHELWVWLGDLHPPPSVTTPSCKLEMTLKDVRFFFCRCLRSGTDLTTPSRQFRLLALLIKPPTNTNSVSPAWQLNIRKRLPNNLTWQSIWSFPTPLPAASWLGVLVNSTR